VPFRQPLRRRATPRTCASSDDDVVLLDAWGRPSGSAPKSLVHSTTTPLHLAFSCHLVGRDGRVLLTRRALTKRTWPGVWTNACCGHPRPGEPMVDAVRRRVAEELGVVAGDIRCVVPDFAYRATMDDGLVEHELCPVFVARVDAPLSPDPTEVDDVRWTTWTDLVERATARPESLSPWSVLQIGRLNELAEHLHELLDARDRALTETSAGPVVVPGGDPFEAVADVDRLLTVFVADRCTELHECDPLASELTSGVGALLAAGGKRLRPAFVHWGFRAAGAAGPTPQSTAAAAAVELLHTFAIIHDDVMDGASTRRRRPAIHHEMGRLRHGELAPRHAERFGESAAVLAGDLAFAWAHEMLGSIDGDVGRCVRRVFSTLCAEAVVGQYMDVRLSRADACDVQARTIAVLKSGRYTVTRPLELGAAVGGADDSTVETLRRYGDAVGVAFQLRDDVLGVFGDDEVTGKSALDDLRDGKASLLMVRARQLATSAGRRVLDEHVGSEELDDERAERCRDVIAASGALASVERLIDDRVESARRTALTLDPPVRDALTALALAASARHA
jgi:geranylgeranyl diphosphate synthase, type I